MSILRGNGRFATRVGRAAVVACGGNAEALARLTPGPRVAGFSTLDLRRLQDQLWGILGRGVDERVQALGIRRDRAEVIGVASVVFTAIGEWLGSKQMIVPGVGVREGLLHDLAAAHFGPATANDERAEALRQQARRFAVRMHSDVGHCEHVRRLGAQLFDQLAPVHGLAPGQRVPLELAAILCDVGMAVNTRDYHKHGEYLVRNADIPGLGRHQQALVACLVRYQAEATPKPHHRLYSTLAPAERQRARQLAGLLRIAVALDAGGTQAVKRVDATFRRNMICLRVTTAPSKHLDVRELRRKTAFFEKEFKVRVQISRARKMPASANDRPARGETTTAGRLSPTLPRRSAA
jgi:exopolyphosphatase/guanosine-5'-triphosphate,3'-diphosphate pyrophosphatase